MNTTKVRGAIMTLLAALLLTLAFSALTAQSASAGLPPICDEYPGLPECDEDPPIPNPDPDPDLDEGAGPTGDSDGNLPFTGYPLSALILLLLLLLVIGLTIRAYLGIRDRITDDGTAGP